MPYVEDWTKIQCLGNSLFVLLEVHFRANRRGTRDTLLSEKGLGTRGGNEKEGTESFTSTYRICVPFSTVPVSPNRYLLTYYRPLAPATDLVRAVVIRHPIRSRHYSLYKWFKLLYSTSRTGLCCTKEQLRGAQFESVFGIVGMVSDPFICKIPFIMIDHEVCVHARTGCRYRNLQCFPRRR